VGNHDDHIGVTAFMFNAALSAFGGGIRDSHDFARRAAAEEAWLSPFSFVVTKGAGRHGTIVP